MIQRAKNQRDNSAGVTRGREMGFKVVQGSDLPGVSDCCAKSFQGTGVDYRYTVCANEDDTIAAAGDADVLILVPSRQSASRRVIENLERCRYLLGIITGYDGIDLQAATERGILVTNMPVKVSEEVSDHTMALILACSRRILQLNRLVRNGEWVADRMGSKLGREIWPQLATLRGQTLGLVGFGKIARSVANKAKGFGMRVIGFDPYVDQGFFNELGVEKVSFARILKDADFVSIHTFLSDETRGMFGMDELKKMKRTAYLINVSRGPIIDREALYTALTTGVIMGAGLDVTDPEPSTPDNNPLVNLENVIMTPHSAGHSQAVFSDVASLVPDQVYRIMRGGWPENLVNPEAKEEYIKRWGHGEKGNKPIRRS
jgi:D-3-phosphoglycerate dehydrogenase / 2-oxoglutarate reductase